MKKKARKGVYSFQRAASLTQQLLAFSRKQILQPKVLDLNVLLKNTEKMLHRLIEEDIVLICEYDPGLGVIKADPVRIEQIVMNLAVNARDVMPRGGNFVIGTKNVSLDDDFCKKYTYSRPGQYVRLLVRDTGSGMNEDVKKRIFEPFFTTKEVGKGTGLGLSTVYGIVKQSGGYITVDSEVDKGTIFNIYFPRTDEFEEKKKPVHTPREPEGGEETILVVEDEESVRNYIEDVLKSSGYKVLKAGNGDEALEIGRLQRTIDLIITDVVMPGKSGPELVEMMQDFHPGTMVLFMSGYNEDFITPRGVVDKEVNFFQKPFTSGSLKQKVRELLDG